MKILFLHYLHTDILEKNLAYIFTIVIWRNMKRQYSFLILIMLLALLFQLPGAITGKPRKENVPKPSYSIEIIREEMVEPLESTAQLTSLPELVPFWVDLVNAELVSADGEGIYVAVLDTGLLDNWPVLFSGANIASSLGKGFTHDITWNPTLNDFEFGPLRDDRGFLTSPIGSGHGSHVTSTIVGYDFYNAFWIRGVAPSATIIPVLVLDYWLVDCPDPNYPDCFGGKVFFRGGTDEMVSAGIYYIADLAVTLDGPVIISMSLGGPSPSQMIEDAIDYAISKGVIIVVAAGNAGYWGMDWPGAYEQVISCAAGGWTQNWVGTGGTWWISDVPEDLKEDDYWGNNWQLYLEDFSGRPSKDLRQRAFQLDVSAPGAAIVGPYQSFVFWDDTIESWVTTPWGYYYLWGTSMATPHVSATSALILQENPTVEQENMEFILKNTASGLPLPCDGAWVYDPWYGLYHFEWYGIDWGKGFLLADEALETASILAK